MTAFLMFLGFLVGMLAGAEFSRKLRARLATALDEANDRADDAEAGSLQLARNLSDVTNDLRRAEGALAARIARDSLRGQRAAATRKAMREARELANERSDAAFDGDGDTLDLPSPFDEGAPTVSASGSDGDGATVTDVRGVEGIAFSYTAPPAQEAA